MRYASLLLIVVFLASCAAQGPVQTPPTPGKRILQWEAREACTAVYIPAQEQGVYLAGIRCP